MPPAGHREARSQHRRAPDLECRPRGFVSEPVMVPRPLPEAATADSPSVEPSEDDGWILCVVWNGARCASDLVILNAADLSEQAVLPMPLALPHGLHGSWAAA